LKGQPQAPGEPSVAIDGGARLETGVGGATDRDQRCVRQCCRADGVPYSQRFADPDFLLLQMYPALLHSRTLDHRRKIPAYPWIFAAGGARFQGV